MNFREYKEYRDREEFGYKLQFIGCVLEAGKVPFEEFWVNRAMPVILECSYQTDEDFLDQLLIEAGEAAQQNNGGNVLGGAMGLATGMLPMKWAGKLANWGADKIGGAMGYDHENPANNSTAANWAMGAARLPGNALQMGQKGLDAFGNYLAKPGGAVDQASGLAGRMAGEFRDQYNAQGGPAFLNAMKHGNIYGPEGGGQEQGQGGGGEHQQVLQNFMQSASALSQAMGDNPQAGTIKQQLQQVINGVQQAMANGAEQPQEPQQQGVPSSAAAPQSDNEPTSGSGVPSSAAKPEAEPTDVPVNQQPERSVQQDDPQSNTQTVGPAQMPNGEENTQTAGAPQHVPGIEPNTTNTGAPQQIPGMGPNTFSTNDEELALRPIPGMENPPQVAAPPTMGGAAGDPEEQKQKPKANPAGQWKHGLGHMRK